MFGRSAKDKRIAELESQVAELQKQLRVALARIAELEEKLKKNSGNSSKPPSSDQPWAKPKPKPKRGKKRRRGGQPGHPKNEKPLVPQEKVDKVVPVKPSHCERCGVPIFGNDPALCVYDGETPAPLEISVVEGGEEAML